MNYTIITNNADQTIQTIIECVRNGGDLQESGIKTWGVVKATGIGDVLVHTAKQQGNDEMQWADVGCLELKRGDDENHKILVNFYFWEKYAKEHQKGDEDRYILGRFTELLLVHFDAQYNKIAIDK